MSHDLTLEREFAADPATVFAFVTDPDHLLDWWGPEGLTVPDHQLDFTAPGPWHSVMVNAEGGRYHVSGTVVSVDPPRSVEFTWAWHDAADKRGHESRVRFEVADNGRGGALFRLIHRAFTDAESVTAHNEGWTSSLRKLERQFT